MTILRDVENVHGLMDDLNEQLDISNDITTAISSLNPGLDDSELAKELQELEQEEFDQKMVDIPVAPKVTIPDQPEETLKEKKKKKNGMYAY